MSILDFLPAPGERHFDADGILAAYGWARVMADSTQSSKHHAEGDVWTHTTMVVDELLAGEHWAAADERSRRILFAAAVLHDIAKPATRRVEPDGDISNRGHSAMGARTARQVLSAEGWPRDEREAVCAIIAVHQKPFWLIEAEEWKQAQTVIGVSLSAGNSLLVGQADADARGRRCRDPQVRRNIIDNVALYGLAAEELGCLDAPFKFSNDHSRLSYLRAEAPQAANPLAELFDPTSPDFVLTMTAGIPGAGKSAWVKQATAPDGICAGQDVVSMDRIRIEMRVAPDDDQGQVRQAAVARAKVLLAKKQSFIWDAVNIDTQRRAPLVQLGLDYGARLRLVSIEAPEEEIRRRNREREARVPDGVMNRMFERWQPPGENEAHELIVSETLALQPASGVRHGPR